MNRTWLIAGVFSAVAAAMPLAQEPQRPVFRADAERVRVDVVVTDRGKPVGDLVADDFEIKDNGRSGTALELTPTTGGISVAVAVDLSGSIQQDGWEEMQDACVAVAESLGPIDTAWLLTFSDRVSLALGPARNPMAIRRALANVELGGRSSVWDAMFSAAAIASGQAGRTLALMLSDGFDTSSYLDEPRAIEVFKRSEVAVTAIRPRHVTDGFIALERAATITGGKVLKSEVDRGIAQQVRDLITEYRLGYVLSYKAPSGPEPRDGWHKIDVKLKNKRGDVRARAGYYTKGK
jgi:VWFA-related protein